MVNTQKNKLSRELSETLLKNKHLLKQIKILLDQSNSFSSELMKITEDITQYLKNINKWPEDVEQKQLGNISFNLIDSHYLEFDKMANFSNLNELKKVIDCLIKARKNGLDTGKIMEENELLLKHSQILQFQIEETLMNCQIKDDLIEKIEQKYVQVKKNRKN